MKLFVLCVLLATAVAQPTKNENWKSAMDEMVDGSRSECAQKSDEVACMKFKVFNLLDQIFSKDNFKASAGASDADGASATRLEYRAFIILSIFLSCLASLKMAHF